MTCRKEMKCKTFCSLVLIVCCILYNVAQFQKVNSTLESVPGEPAMTGQSRDDLCARRQDVLRYEEATEAGNVRTPLQGQNHFFQCFERTLYANNVMNEIKNQPHAVIDACRGLTATERRSAIIKIDLNLITQKQCFVSAFIKTLYEFSLTSS